MSTTDQVIKAATELGKLIAEHSDAKKFDATTNLVHEDTEAQRILNDYNRHLMTIHEKETQGKPIEVEDKRKLESCQQQVIQSSTLRNLQVAQMDYLDLMRRVEEAMQGSRPNVSPVAAAESPVVIPDVQG